MYEYLPGSSDVQPMAAWLAVMEKAHVNLSMYVNFKVNSNAFEEKVGDLKLLLFTFWTYYSVAKLPVWDVFCWIEKCRQGVVHRCIRVTVLL